MIYDDATCYRCGANAWTSCQHREATRQRPDFVDKPDRQELAKKRAGGGKYGFKSASESMNKMTRKTLREGRKK